jgi:hypothetical protein
MLVKLKLVVLRAHINLRELIFFISLLISLLNILNNKSKNDHLEFLFLKIKLFNNFDFSIKMQNFFLKKKTIDF